MKKLLCLLLCSGLIVTLCSSTFATRAAEQPLDLYTIDEPYVYPVLPGTDEWRALDSLTKKIIACDIPEEIISQMTTEALLETVLTYPLLVNIYAFSNIETGIASVSSYFPALTELLSRGDTASLLATYACPASDDMEMIPLYIESLLRYLTHAA